MTYLMELDEGSSVWLEPFDVGLCQDGNLCCFNLML